MTQRNSNWAPIADQHPEKGKSIEPISPDGRPIPGDRYVVPPRCGRAVRLEAGDRLTIHNPTGSQVCDFWAFTLPDMHEFLSMEHLRTALGRTIPRPGDGLVTNLREPLMAFIEDSSPGIHDTIIAACDRARYEQLGASGYHANCTDNLAMALQAIGLSAPEVPAPFNIWMNIPVESDGAFRWEAPVASAGDHVVFQAKRSCVAVMSACPQDMTPINGVDASPTSLSFEVRR